eukprot:snap_masked-scaffold_2-processed-gene-24.10-mRNA-1 protein AED:1.00 eAED:1.00 QI:0/0/0/0/1/1/8/0/718
MRIVSLESSILEASFGTSKYDLAARALFTPRTSGLYLIEIRLNPNTTFLNVEHFFALLSVLKMKTTRIRQPLSQSISGQIFSASSKVFEIQLRSNRNYTFLLDASFNSNITKTYQKKVNSMNETLELPKIFPGIVSNIHNTKTNEVLKSGSTNCTIGFEKVDEHFVQTVSASSQFTVEFSSDRDQNILLDVFSINPEYFARNFYDEIESLPWVSTGSLHKRFVDPEFPFESCEISPFEFLGNGCQSGVFFFCRNKYQPLADVSLMTVEQAQSICTCTELLCVESPGSQEVSSKYLETHEIFVMSVLILSSAMLLIGVLVFLDVRRWRHLKSPLQIPNKFSYYISMVFFLTSIVSSSFSLLLQTRMNMLRELSSAVTFISDVSFTEEDLFFYHGSPFEDFYDYMGMEQNEYEGRETLNPTRESYLNTEAQVIFDKLSNLYVFTRGHFQLSALNYSIVVIYLLEVAAEMSQVSRKAATVMRKKDEVSSQRFLYMIRFLEFSLGLSGVWYAVLMDMYGGGVFSSASHFILGSLHLFAVLLLMYSRIKFHKINYINTTADQNYVVSRIKSRQKQDFEIVFDRLQNVAVIIAFCGIGFAVSQFYYGFHYRTKMEKAIARSENVTSTFNMFSLSCAMVAVCAGSYFFLCEYLRIREVVLYRSVSESMQSNPQTYQTMNPIYSTRTNLKDSVNKTQNYDSRAQESSENYSAYYKLNFSKFSSLDY